MRRRTMLVLCIAGLGVLRLLYSSGAAGWLGGSGHAVSPSLPWAAAPGAFSGPPPAGGADPGVPPAGAALATTCLGPEAASFGVIYLHGIDLPAASPQEQGNRAGLARLAEELGIRLALARSPDTCLAYPGKRCWPNDSRPVVEATLAKLLADTSPCFAGGAPDRPPRQPLAAVVGFSNGGYFVGKLFQYCLLPQVAELIAVGSAGSWRPEDPRLGLEACGHLTQLVGREDIVHNDAGVFVQHLVERGGQAELREYDGGHVLPLAEVGAALRALKGQ